MEMTNMRASSIFIHFKENALANDSGLFDKSILQTIIMIIIPGICDIRDTQRKRFFSPYYLFFFCFCSLYLFAW